MKLRVVIASPYLPWPLTDGGKAAQYRTLEALQDCCDFTLLVPIDNLEQDRNAKMLAERLPRVTVDAVRQFRPAAPPSLLSMAGKTSDRILRKLMYEPAPAWPEPPPADSPFYPFNGVSRNFLTALEMHLAKGCDIFQAEFAEMLPVGPLMNGRLPSLFVHHQLQFVYARRFLEERASVSVMARYLTERMIREERTYLATFDAAIVFSEVDRSALENFSPQLPVYVSPFPAPEELPATAALCSRTINRFVFVAGESHKPNVEGLAWFMKDVWPFLKQDMPDVAFEVIGEWSVAAQARLPNYKDIRFLGFVPDLGKALQGGIMVVPVRVGSGIRTKILAAWGASCPVVATTIGAEGLPGIAGEHYAVADGAMEFASACIKLAQDVGAVNRMIVNGLEMARKFYSPEAVRSARMNCYEKLLAAGPKFKP